MNEPFPSRSDIPATESTQRRILVWDAPIRVFHWLTVVCFAGAYLTSENDELRLVHVTLGYTLGALIVFRVIWGMVGTRYARFSDFVRGPAVVKRYLAGMLRGRPEHFVGHNPGGAVAIVALLLLGAVVTVTGWAIYTEVGGEWLEEWHEAAANIMLILVGVHIAGVVLGSWAHRENLVAAMISGFKIGRPEQGIRNAWRGVAVLLLAAVLAFWWWQWQDAPASGSAEKPAAAHSHDHHNHRH